MDTDALFTWQALQTLAGAAAITYLIVAYFGRLIDRVWPPLLGTDVAAWLVGALVLMAATAANGVRLTWDTSLLAAFNGFLVAATAGKIRDKAVNERDRKFTNDAGV